jgi:hypothetical protein
MHAIFELWDVNTANTIGTFATTEEAVDAVTNLLDAYGPDYAKELNLTRRLGDEQAQIVAEGKQLIAMVSTRRASLSELSR